MEIENEAYSLKVIGTYMGNTKRSVSSLSGGGTFKLSLALAFGLSDLAARNVVIESLFIDEGFGLTRQLQSLKTCKMKATNLPELFLMLRN